MRRNHRDWCSICGKVGPTGGHRCKPSTYAGIDAANTRAANAAANPTDKLWYPGVTRDLTFGGRLQIGFDWLNGGPEWDEWGDDLDEDT